MAKKQQECCDQILKRLDKLDDILAAIKNLEGENDRLKSEDGDLRNQRMRSRTRSPACQAAQRAANHRHCP